MKILCVKRSHFDDLGSFQGFSPAVSHYNNLLFKPEFIERADAELDPTYKQIIPYAILRNSDRIFGDRIYSYQRGSKGGEKRLHAKRSIGWGGHVDESDIPAGDMIRFDPKKLLSRIIEAQVREIDEEVKLMIGVERVTQVGWINEDDTPVGRVHIGMLNVIDLSDVQTRELNADENEGIEDGRWTDLKTLLSERDVYELWSQHAIDWAVNA